VEAKVDVLRLREHDLLWREVDDEVVILDLKASLYASLNATGRLLWLQLAGGATTEELGAALQAAYGIEADVAARDVQAFLAALDEQGLLA
jgi:hypothetical protein